MSVPKDVKEILARKKGKSDWGEFLLELYMRAEYARMKENYDELRKLLSAEELDGILESSREFRERLRIR